MLKKRASRAEISSFILSLDSFSEKFIRAKFSQVKSKEIRKIIDHLLEKGVIIKSSDGFYQKK